MAEQINDKVTAAGIFKDTYGENIKDAYGYMTRLLNMFPLEAGKEAGGVFHQPVLMQLAHGITYAPGSTTPGFGGAKYVAARGSLVPDLKIAGVQTYTRELVSYEAMMDSLSGIISSGMTNKEKMAAGKKAIQSVVGLSIDAISRSAVARLEFELLHGSSPEGLGVIEAVGTATAANHPVTGVAGFGIDVRITAEQWCRANWAVSLGATIDVYTVASPAVKSNTAQNTNLDSSGGGTSSALELIDLNPSTLYAGLTGDNLRVIRLWHTANSGTGITSVAAGRALFWESATPYTVSTGPSSIVGIDTLARIGSGETGIPTVVHGLDSTKYAMAKGNVIPSAGIVQMDSLMSMLETPFSFGVAGQKMIVVVSGKEFTNLAASESSLIRYNNGEKKAKTGFAELSFVGLGGMEVTVIASQVQKDGKITCFPEGEVHRIGSQELSFLKNGGTEFALESSNGAAKELRGMGKFNLYADCPRHLLSVSGVTY